MNRYHLAIHGRVQGVYYRKSTQQKAKALGLTGWVRNLPDGSVEAEAQGTPEVLDALIAWCHSGPEHAVVSTVQATAQDVVPAEQGFVVRAN